MITLGIDPGITGALAALDHNGALRVIDMPIRRRAKTGKTQNEVHPRELLDWVHRLLPAGESAIVVMEDMHAFMGEKERVGSMSSQASLAATKAVVRAVFELAGHETTLVTPQCWQGFYGIKKREGADTKSQSLTLARDFYPGIHMTKTGGRPDAILIARWAQRNLT
ncbi:hypothetical protein [Burkholderia gladioli]|uniref:hypothetical protein n=1 Tax=Burkholderia gladioli TaxID=28095 RepID=UPI00163FD952|nr:hypothetical protein [Burkholderia gladioli]